MIVSCLTYIFQNFSEIFLSLQLIKVFVEKDIGQQIISFILDNPVHSQFSVVTCLCSYITLHIMKQATMTRKSTLFANFF